MISKQHSQLRGIGKGGAQCGLPCDFPTKSGGRIYFINVGIHLLMCSGMLCSGFWWYLFLKTQIWGRQICIYGHCPVLPWSDQPCEYNMLQLTSLVSDYSSLRHICRTRLFISPLELTLEGYYLYSNVCRYVVKGNEVVFVKQLSVEV